MFALSECFQFPHQRARRWIFLTLVLTGEVARKIGVEDVDSEVTVELDYAS